jgi:N-acetylmuramoyl-L-alanine amidase
LVLLDPGHGGTNSGAASVDDTVYEKHLTLALAFNVRDRLVRKGVRVVLTRERDIYLTLRQRGNQANALGADAFVSIHGNATEAHTQRGYETFILTPEALDVDGRALRITDGVPRPGLPEALARVMDDVERGTAHAGAAALATAIQDQLKQVRGREGDRGVRQASMHVLLGATMPAVLVEVGFIDHPIEGPELLAPRTRDDVAEAIASGIAASVLPAR